MAQSQTKPQIRRKDSIPESARTPDRDEAAEYIEDMWPATLSDISDESGYSVSHIHNTLNKYFERVNEDFEGGGQTAKATNDTQATAKTPEYAEEIEEVRERRHEVDVPDAYLDSPDKLQAYLHGWGDGFIDCRLDRSEDDNGDDESDE